MIEGGGGVINSLLLPEYFSLMSSVIVTIAPTWLGNGGVVVSPLDHAEWHPFGEDVVLCGKVKL